MRAALAPVLLLVLAGCADDPLATGTVTGTVWYGPVCPVEQQPPDPACADRPYQTDLEATTADGADVVARFRSGADGNYSVAVAPGEYLIRGNGQQPPTCATGPFTVEADNTTHVDVACDSGIR